MKKQADAVRKSREAAQAAALLIEQQQALEAQGVRPDPLLRMRIERARREQAESAKVAALLARRAAAPEIADYWSLPCL